MSDFKKVTIAQISEKAGVSVATVSRIINKNGYVKPETREKVTRAMNELGYQPKFIQTTDMQKTNSILVAMPDFRNPFNSDIIDGIQAAALNRGTHPFYYEMKDFEHSIEEYERILKKNNFCGILLVHNIENTELLEDLRLRYPVVMCSEHCDHPSISFVSIDDNFSAQTAINYLISMGHTKIAFINSMLNNNYAKHREKGFFAAMSHAALSTKPDWIAHISNINFEMASSVVSNILDGQEKPTAFFCVSDVFAAAAVKAIRNHGLRVPEDVSVIGFDNIDLSKMIVPSLTTISQPSFQIGHQSCDLLIDLIETPSSPTRHIILNTELIVRESVAPRSDTTNQNF